jgi:hypothetical protein
METPEARSDALAGLGAVRRVDLSGWPLDGAAALACRLLGRGPHDAVSGVDLYGQRSVGPAGTARVARALPRHAGALRTLALYGCDAGDAGARSLAAALPSLRRLETLDLRWNAVGDAGAASIARAAAQCAALRRVDLRFNALSDAAAQKVRDAPTLGHCEVLV